MKTIKIVSKIGLEKSYFPKKPFAFLNHQKKMPLDKFNRKLTDVRISLIDKCNFRCTYCMPKTVFDDNYQFLGNKDLLTFEEVVFLSSAFIKLGAEKLRLTGGEPLLRKNVEDLVKVLANLRTIERKPVEIALTTNGTLLFNKAQSLFDAGLQRITVSLDSLNQEIFEAISDTNFNVKEILKGIDHAKKIGLEVKVNMVVRKGLNENQIIPMAKYFKNRGVTLRFIEFMDVGSSNSWKKEKVATSQEILTLLKKEFVLNYIGRENANDVSEKWQYDCDETQIGLISSVTNPFCKNCTRARISADGFLYTCLFASNGFDLKSILRSTINNSDKSNLDQKNRIIELLAQHISEIWHHRADRYSELRSLNPETSKKRKIEMSYIGG